MRIMRSRFATTASLRLLLFALAVSGTSAIFCDFYHENISGGNAVSNQEELETLYAGCTEIDGTVNIAANYTGDFYFPNVTYISGGFRTEYIRSRDYDDQPIPAPLLTSIVVPDLNNTYYMDINSVPALTTISFPSLTVLSGSISLVGIEDCAVDFPSLKTSGGLIVTGNSTSLNFPKLAHVGFMRVSRNPSQESNADYWGDHMIVDPVDQLPLDINFPALQIASSVYLQGNISNLSMPQLFRIGEDQYFNRYIKILTHGNPLDISLPRLYDLKDISVAGTIGSISFPVLKSLERFQVNTSTPLNVTLEPIQTISDYMTLEGNVIDVSMTSITELGGLNIESDSSDFYCSSIASDFERSVGRPLKDYECTGQRKKSKLPLILGLSIGLGVPMLLAFVAYKCWQRSAAKKRQELKASTPPQYEMGVPPIYSTTSPPTYGASEGDRGSEQGVADMAGARMGNGNSTRGEGESVNSAGDAATARPGDGSSAHQEGAYGRRAVPA